MMSFHCLREIELSFLPGLHLSFLTKFLSNSHVWYFASSYSSIRGSYWNLMQLSTNFLQPSRPVSRKSSSLMNRPWTCSIRFSRNSSAQSMSFLAICEAADMTVCCLCSFVCCTIFLLSALLKSLRLVRGTLPSQRLWVAFSMSRTPLAPLGVTSDTVQCRLTSSQRGSIGQYNLLMDPFIDRFLPRTKVIAVSGIDKQSFKCRKNPKQPKAAQFKPIR